MLTSQQNVYKREQIVQKVTHNSISAKIKRFTQKPWDNYDYRLRHSVTAKVKNGVSHFEHDLFSRYLSELKR